VWNCKSIVYALFGKIVLVQWGTIISIFILFLGLQFVQYHWSCLIQSHIFLEIKCTVNLTSFSNFVNYLYWYFNFKINEFYHIWVMCFRKEISKSVYFTLFVESWRYYFIFGYKCTIRGVTSILSYNFIKLNWL
jgi:hypothetical protein